MAQINYQPFDTKDFAAILQHLKFRSKQSNPYDLDSLSDMSEYAYDFITWSVKPWGSAQGYKRPPQGVNEVIVVAQYV